MTVPFILVLWNERRVYAQHTHTSPLAETNTITCKTSSHFKLVNQKRPPADETIIIIGSVSQSRWTNGIMIRRHFLSGCCCHISYKTRGDSFFFVALRWAAVVVVFFLLTKSKFMTLSIGLRQFTKCNLVWRLNDVRVTIRCQRRHYELTGFCFLLPDISHVSDSDESLTTKTIPWGPVRVGEWDWPTQQVVRCCFCSCRRKTVRCVQSVAFIAMNDWMQLILRSTAPTQPQENNVSFVLNDVCPFEISSDKIQ